MRTALEYRQAVHDMAIEAVAEAGEDFHEYATESVEQSDWIIYTVHNLAVIQHTDHDDAVFDVMGSDAFAGLKNTSEVYQRIAMYAMLADVEEEAQHILEDEG